MKGAFLAHTLSIIGHPAILVPGAALLAALNRAATLQQVWPLAMLLGGIVVAVVIYSGLKVWRGHWVDMDASAPSERHQLNRFLMPLLFAAAGLSWWLDQPAAIPAGLVAAGLLVTIAHLLKGRWKVSLHTGFAVFAMFLLVPHLVSMLALAVLAGAIAWSRLILSRHTSEDVIIGALAGMGAGLIFLLAS